MALQQTPYANGWDGYYYIMQVHSWRVYGRLQSADFSLIYPYFALISYIINDYEQTYKIGASLLSAGLLSSAMVFTRSISKEDYLAILVGCFLLFSPTLTFITAQFPKNVLGLIVFFLMLTSINKRKYVLTIILFCISLFTHRMVAGISIIIVALSVIQQINFKYVLVGIALIMLVSLLPGIIHFSDFSRLNGQLDLIPQFVPYSIYKLFGASISFWWTIELILLTALVMYLLFNYFKMQDFKSSNSILRIILPTLLVVSVFPFFIIEAGSIGYRFFMITPIVLSIYFVCKVKIRLSYALSAALIFIAFSMFSYTSYNPSLHDPPNKLYEVIVNRMSNYYDVDDYPLVIVHKSLAELLIYKTDFDALNWAPNEAIEKDKIIRIVHNLDYYHFAKYLSDKELENVKKLTLHYYAIPETLWKNYLNLVMQHNDEALLNLIRKGNNPLEQRPLYLSKGKDL